MTKTQLIITETIVIFLFVFIFNYIVFVRKNKKLKKDEMPLELTYISYIYALDPKKIHFRRFQYTYSLINAFIITTTYILVTYLIKMMLFKIIVGIALLILLIIICYGLLGKYYQYKELKNSRKKK